MSVRVPESRDGHTPVHRRKPEEPATVTDAHGNSHHAEVVSRGPSCWTTLNSRALRVPEDNHRVLVPTTRQFDGLPTSRGWNYGGERRGRRVGGLVVVVDLLLTNIVRIQTREFLPEGSHCPLPPPPCVACHSPRRHGKLQGRETH